jgi:subtilase family serine protease
VTAAAPKEDRASSDTDNRVASDSPAVDAFAPFVEAPAVRHLPRVEAPASGPGGAAAPAALPAPAAALGVPSAGDAAASAPAAGGGGAAAPLLESLSPVHPDRGPSSPFLGYSPAQIRHAYGFDQLAADGTGQTIAIVDAYDAPNVFNDLNTFDGSYSINGGSQTLRQQYGDASTFLTKVNQTGGTAYPAPNTGWAQEISLDVQWAHVIAPAAKILLVEANSSSFADLLTAVDYAAQNAHVVSMSWGGGDFSGEAGLDSHFNVPGVTFLASSGDSGGRVEYPAASPYVVSVGGTSLTLSGNNYQKETGWSSVGGGASSYEPEPGYQTGYNITNTNGHRGTPDVAYDADPNTGVPVIYNGGLYVFGGTSVGAPQWAGLVALANQGRTTPLTSSSLTTSPVYTAATGATTYAANYHDITSGRAGFYRAGTGYDLVTGLGSPVANQLVLYLQGL